MKKTKGYRLHFEGSDAEPEACCSMKSVRQSQRDAAKKYKQTFKEIEKISYIVTEEEYQESLKP